MLTHEDLWIKISDDFHTELNPILEQLIPTSKQKYWFDKKGIPGKFFILNEMLYSFNKTESNRYKLTRLLNCLELYKIRVKGYLDLHVFATCFVYFTPERGTSTMDYFFNISNYSINFSKSFSSSILYMIGMDIIGFPNDCSYKLIAKLSNHDILIEKQIDPFFPIEIERGKLVSNTLRNGTDRYEIECQFKKKYPQLWKRKESIALQKFTDFATETHLKNIALLKDFDRNIDYCKSIIDNMEKDTTVVILPEIERIYSVLKNGYIKEPFERFREIFHADYSGDKIIWLKSGAELKYFLDRIITKIYNSYEINLWADKRFTLLKPPSNFVRYLGDVKQKNSLYQKLEDKLLPKNPICILSKGF